jgi:hypothetical protein
MVNATYDDPQLQIRLKIFRWSARTWRTAVRSTASRVERDPITQQSCLNRSTALDCVRQPRTSNSFVMLILAWVKSPSPLYNPGFDPRHWRRRGGTGARACQMRISAGTTPSVLWSSGVFMSWSSCSSCWCARGVRPGDIDNNVIRPRWCTPQLLRSMCEVPIPWSMTRDKREASRGPEVLVDE